MLCFDIFLVAFYRSMCRTRAWKWRLIKNQQLFFSILSQKILKFYLKSKIFLSKLLKNAFMINRKDNSKDLSPHKDCSHLQLVLVYMKLPVSHLMACPSWHSCNATCILMDSMRPKELLCNKVFRDTQYADNPVEVHFALHTRIGWWERFLWVHGSCISVKNKFLNQRRSWNFEKILTFGGHGGGQQGSQKSDGQQGSQDEGQLDSIEGQQGSQGGGQ